VNPTDHNRTWLRFNFLPERNQTSEMQIASNRADFVKVNAH
jgi:hypothetical protein